MFVARSARETGFDAAEIVSRRRQNLVELRTELLSPISERLDVYSKWRELAALADGTKYAVSALEVEQFAKVVHCDLKASPTQCLLNHWGLNRVMTGETLAYYLDMLRIEEPLKHLKLPEQLMITVQPQSSLVAVEGGELELNCEAVGFPYPVYEWFKEQKRINSGVSNTGRLVISNVTANVVGLYVCRIHHTNHVTGETFVLFTDWCTVEYQPRPIPHPVTPSIQEFGSVPVILEHPESQSLRQKETLVLSCLAQSPSAVQYHWVKNGSLIAAGSQVRIAMVDVTDAGEYFCIVKNDFGEIRSKSAMVTVDSETCIQAPRTPQIQRQPVDLSVGIGGDAVFVVEAEFVSRLSYQWFHNGKSVADANGPELRFPVEDSSSSGTYHCVVTSAQGQSVLSDPAKLSVTAGNPVFKAADKLALLIGVSTYKSHGVPLPAVKNDFQETVKVLEAMQFKVVSLLDLTLREMEDAIDMFYDLLSPDVYTIFYCAGHGFIGNNGRHYLIPWDAHQDVNPAECICIEDVENKIQEKKPKLLMFCLDICRRRLPTDSLHVGDLSAAKSAPNRIVLYAASEGQQAFEQSKKSSNKPRGLFNQYLLEVVHKRMRIVDLYCALIDKFKHSPYRTSPFYRDSFRQNPEIATNCEDHERSLHDPLDTKRFQETINKQTVLWHRVHRLPSGYVLQIPDKLGTVEVRFDRITSNVMEISLTSAGLQPGWDFTVHLPSESVPAALRPAERRLSGPSTTSFRVENLQRLRQDLRVTLNIQLTCGSSVRQYMHSPDLGRPLIAFAYSRRAPSYQLPQLQTERKEAMEHTEDHSLSSET